VKVSLSRPPEVFLPQPSRGASEIYSEIAADITGFRLWSVEELIRVATTQGEPHDRGETFPSSTVTGG
jgi:hypothetical protein